MNASLDAIIRACIHNRAVVLLAAVALIVAGIWHLHVARIDALPRFTPPIVVVHAEAPGYSSVGVARQITAPLEQALLGIPGATRVRSTSTAGLAILQITFADDVDIFVARQLVGERIARASSRLPEHLPRPQLAPIVSPIGAVLKFAYRLDAGGDATFDKLSRLVLWRVAPRLRALPGVARVSVHGATAPRMEVRPDPVRMIGRGVRLGDLRDAIARGQAKAVPGPIRSGPQLVALRANTRWSIARPGALRDAVVRSRRQSTRQDIGTRQEDAPVRVGDVAQVVIGHVPPVGQALMDGHRAVYVQIDKLPWADTLAVTRRAKRVLRALDALLPPGCTRAVPVFQQADFIHTSIGALQRAMLLGAGLVVFILFVFLRSPRAVAVSLTALPLSMLAAVLMLRWRGVTIDAMVLGGLTIAVGEVVDDAIVDVENVWRRLRENTALAHPRPRLDVIHDASVEVRGAVVYASLIIVVVLLPVLTIGGLAGRIFSPLAEAYVLAVLASLGVALTVTPALCATLLHDDAGLQHPDGPIDRYTSRVYMHILAGVRKRPGRAVLGTILVGLLSLVALPFLGGGFLPEFHEGVLIAEVTAWPGTSLAETTRLAGRLTALLRDREHLPHVGARIGRATLDEDASPIHRIEMDLVLPPSSEDPDEAATSIARRLAAVPGIRVAVDGFLGERINELLAGERAPVAVDLRGGDLHTIRVVAAGLLGSISALAGVVSVRCRALVDEPTARLAVRSDAVALAGVQRAGLIDAVAVGGRGLPVTYARAPNGFRIPVVLVSPAPTRGFARLADLPIQTAGGNMLPLSSLATIRPGSEPWSIQHEGGQPRVVVTAQVQSRDVPRVGRAIEQLLRRTPLPDGVTWKLSGQAAERARATSRLVVAAVLVAIAVVVFLWLAFHSAVDALVVVAGIPVGLAGGVLAALLLPDGPSLAGLVGFVTLAGIISRNGIMLVAHKNQLLASHGEQPVADLVLLAARERLRPILMTAGTAFGGLLPLALSLDVAGSELQAPMALIVCGGLVTATLLNLVAVPAFYLWLAGREDGDVMRTECSP